MTQISRLRNAEIANGNLINADDISAELNQLVTESNNQDTRLTTIESGTLTISGNKTLSGNSTFSGTTTFSNTANFSGAVTLSGTIGLSGQTNLARTTDPGTPNNGDLWYNATSNVFKAQVNGLIRTLATTSDLVLPANFRGSAAPVYASSSTFTVATIRDRSVDNTTDLVKTTSTTFSKATTGLNGLDTGTATISTWYYLYTVTDGTNVGLLASTINESVSGTISNANFAYTAKLQQPFAFYIDASGNLTPFVVGPGWPRRPKIMLDVDSTASPWQIASAVNNTSFTTITCSILPDIAISVDLSGYAVHNSLAGAGWGWMRTGGSTTNGRNIAYTNAVNNAQTTNAITVVDLPLSSTKTIQYKTSGSNGPNMTFGITGFTARVD